MTQIKEKNSYVAKDDAIISGNQSPNEPVYSSFQIATAERLSSQQGAETEARRVAMTMALHGGLDVAKKGRLFESIVAEAGSLAGTVTLRPAVAEYDPTGKQFAGFCPRRDVLGRALSQPASSFVLNTDDLSFFEDLVYEDDGATLYNIGIAISTVPTRAFQNPRIPRFEFDTEAAVIGVSFQPETVSYDAGSNEITLELETNLLAGNGSSLAGRSALAWYNDPQGETATAIQIGTLTYTTNNRLVLPGAFGQNVSLVDTDAANYVVCVLGPVVSAGAKNTDIQGVAWIANGRNAVGWDTDGQNRYPTTDSMLRNLLRMSDPSVSAPDLTSNPKISIRPNDNEPGSELQIAVYKDAAASTLAFAVDKDGNLYFDGDLTGIGTTPFSFGVDTASPGFEAGLNIFHTESGGVGIPGKGVRLDMQVESTSEGVRENVGSISSRGRDVTPAAFDGETFLSSVKSSVEVPSLYISEHGECFFGQNVRSKIGLASDGVPANGYDPHVAGSLSASVYAVGNSDNRIGSFNTTPQDGAGLRTSRVSFAGITAAGTVHEQALWGASAAVAGTSVESQLSGFVNNGSGLDEACRLSYFDDWDDPGTQAASGLRVSHLRSLGGSSPVKLSWDQHAASGDESVQELILNSNTDSPTMIAANATARLSWRMINTDPFDDEFFHISAGPVSGGYEARFAGFDPGVERLAMNIHFDSSVVDTRVEIQSLGIATPDPFTSQNRSPLQVLHDDSGDKYGGIDIGNRTAGNGDGDRSSGINFLGVQAGTGTEVRHAGIRAHFDNDIGTGTLSEGKMMLFVNDGSGTSTIANGLEIYSDGYIRSKGTPAWASVQHGIPPVFESQVGFDGGVAITNPSTGVYVLTLKTPMVGAALTDPVFVQGRLDGHGGRGVWLSNQTIECRVWNVSGTLVNTDFFVAAFSGAQLRVAP